MPNDRMELDYRKEVQFSDRKDKEYQKVFVGSSPNFEKNCRGYQSPGQYMSPYRSKRQGERLIPSRRFSKKLYQSLDQPGPSDLQDQENNPGHYLALRQHLLSEDRDLFLCPDRASLTEEMRSPKYSQPTLRWQADTRSPVKRGMLNRFATSATGNDPPPGSLFNHPPRQLRNIPKSPWKVLDAPHLQDDFYLNLVDWSVQSLLAVGLGSQIYLWNSNNCKVNKLTQFPDGETVCSVSFSPRSTYLAVGTSKSKTYLFDIAHLKKVRTLNVHTQRVGSLCWNEHILTSGGRDRRIIQTDVRDRDDVALSHKGHTSEVCGLKWGDDTRLASGGNDNALMVWDKRTETPLKRLEEHRAAVKAIAWSPHKHGLLASGGGTSDKCIKFWNILSPDSNSVSTMDTGSQVCNLAWSKNVNELVSTHGYSQNQLVVWRCPQMTKLATLTGHQCRVLYLALSPDGRNIVTGAGDETLRFWSVFPEQQEAEASEPSQPYSWQMTMQTEVM